MYQNNLTKGFQNYLNKPVNYMNNQILNNNPLYMSNIHDQSFYQRMMLQKEEEIRKIKNISDLGMSKEQIIEYVIAPLKIEKSDANEIIKLYDDENNKYTEDYIKKNWWVQRTNAPYKNILKDENWKKEIKSSADLIVHKVTDLDKVGLEEDFFKLQKLLENHDGELKVIFSASKESEYKKSFKFVQKYKYRMKYDPKDYNDLKNYYKKEQKKYDRDQKRLDEIIGLIMDDDKIDDKELKQIESEFFKPSSKVKKNKKSKNDSNDIEEQIQEMIAMYGEEDIEKIIKELEESDNESDNPKHKEKEKKKDKEKKKIKSDDKIKHNDKKKIKNNDKNVERESERHRDRDREKEKEKIQKNDESQPIRKEIRKVVGISIKRDNIKDNDITKDKNNQINVMIKKEEKEQVSKTVLPNEPKIVKGIRIGNKTNIN